MESIGAGSKLDITAAGAEVLFIQHVVDTVDQLHGRPAAAADKWVTGVLGPVGKVITVSNTNAVALVSAIVTRISVAILVCLYHAQGVRRIGLPGLVLHHNSSGTALGKISRLRAIRSFKIIKELKHIVAVRGRGCIRVPVIDKKSGTCGWKIRHLDPDAGLRGSRIPTLNPEWKLRHAIACSHSKIRAVAFRR